MTPADLALARRAVACRGWTLDAPHEDPRGGCGYTETRCASGVLWRFVDPDGTAWRKPAQGEHSPCWLPDLDDDATLGCLVGLVREAKNDPFFDVVGVAGRGWRWREAYGWSDTYWSEPDSLVAALEGACQG